MHPLAIALLLALAVGCGEGDIRVYDAPKDSPAPRPSGPRAEAPGSAPAAGGEVRWSAPAAWTHEPASGMRLATFRIPAAGGEVEMSVVALAGPAGGTLANVNRWRGQLGLPPLDAAGLAAGASRVRSAAGDVVVVEAVSADGARGLLGGVLERPERTWFFKATGTPAGLAAARSELLEFLRTLRAESTP